MKVATVNIQVQEASGVVLTQAQSTAVVEMVERISENAEDHIIASLDRMGLGIDMVWVVEGL